MLNHSHKVIFSIFALTLLVAVPLAYAATGTFILGFAGNEIGGGTVFGTLDGIAVNSTGFIIAGDSDSNLVQIYDSTGSFIRATVGGTAFQTPQNIAVNSTDFIFVGDEGADTVQIFNRGGYFQTTFNGNNLGGGTQFTALSAIAINSTNFIFVGDFDLDTIQIFDKGGVFLRSIDGSDAGGTDFDGVVDITTDSNNRIIVLDANADTVQIFDSNGSFLSTFTGTGTSGGGTAFDDPEGIATDSSDRIYVADNAAPDTVQIYDSTGAFLTSFDGSDGAGTIFSDLRAIAIDSDNRVFTGDATVARVQIYEGFVPTNPDKPSGGSGDQAHKTRPTFGLSHTTFAQQVEGGFSFNGKSHDITDNFWTPFAEQNVKLGQTNTFTAKVLAEQKLRVQEFLFGIPVVGEAHKAELGVEIFYNYDGTVDRVQVIQKTDVIDVDSVKIMHSMTNCLSSDTDEKCDITRLSMKFLEPLKDKIMAIKAIDFKGRSHFTFLNEGFDISGDSLNPMNTKFIPGPQKYEGLVEITQTAKYSDIWVAKDGREFKTNEYDSFKQINQSFERHTDTGVMKNRMHSEFSEYKQDQINRALMILTQLCENCSDEPFDKINNIVLTTNMKPTLRSDDMVLQEALLQENIRATEILEKLFEHLYPLRVFDE